MFTTLYSIDYTWVKLLMTIYLSRDDVTFISAAAIAMARTDLKYTCSQTTHFMHGLVTRLGTMKVIVRVLLLGNQQCWTDDT